MSDSKDRDLFQRIVEVSNEIHRNTVRSPQNRICGTLPMPKVLREVLDQILQGDGVGDVVVRVSGSSYEFKRVVRPERTSYSMEDLLRAFEERLERSDIAMILTVGGDRIYADGVEVPVIGNASDILEVANEGSVMFGIPVWKEVVSGMSTEIGFQMGKLVLPEDGTSLVKAD